MTAVPLVVLDACVLVNYSLCDLLLRLAEVPPIFEPKWSEKIMAETIYMANGIRDWKTFVEAGQTFFDTNRGCPMFQIIETMDDLYRLAYLKAPFPKIGDREEDTFFHMCFLICHRALLSAATSTGSGRPEDGPAVTRRALEAAKVCLEVKADPDNFFVWKAVGVRKERWETRGKGVRPKGAVNLKYKGVPVEPLYENLKSLIGTLSDFTVHFTPEHVRYYEWQQNPRPDGGNDNSFGMNEDAVSYHILLLADQHRTIFHVFDHCLDGNILSHPEVKLVAQRALEQYKVLLQSEGFSEAVATVGDTW